MALDDRHRAGDRVDPGRTRGHPRRQRRRAPRRGGQWSRHQRRAGHRSGRRAVRGGRLLRGTFNRARRSAILADHQAATALRKAAKELAYASSEPGGLAIALLFATVHLARAAAKWHEQRGHEQQAAVVEEALRHLQAGYQQAATPVLADLTRRAPRAATAHRFEQDVRAALPDHADRILADPTWSALTTTLAQAEPTRHNPRRLLIEVSAQRELDSAERPAEVLNWRITAQPNRRAQAARSRSTTSGTSSMSATLRPPATPAATRPEERSRHR